MVAMQRSDRNWTALHRCSRWQPCTREWLSAGGSVGMSGGANAAKGHCCRTTAARAAELPKDGIGGNVVAWSSAVQQWLGER
jgi:hypothetical protein